jgi:molecular chaperone GrpE (heat shock protein)
MGFLSIKFGSQNPTNIIREDAEEVIPVNEVECPESQPEIENDEVESVEADAVSAEEEIPTEDKPAEETLEQLLNSFSDMIQNEMHTVAEALVESISDKINKTSLSFSSRIKDEFTNTLEKQENTIQKQHQTITKFQEDLLYKLQKPLIMEIIGIADNIRMIIQEHEKSNDYGSLLEAVKDLEKWVEATLSNNSVHSFRDSEQSDTELNRKRQEVIDTEDTDDPEKNNTYISERPGYLWTMPYLVINSDVQLEKIVRENAQPQMFTYVIRPESLIKLKYRKD